MLRLKPQVSQDAIADAESGDAQFLKTGVLRNCQENHCGDFDDVGAILMPMTFGHFLFAGEITEDREDFLELLYSEFARVVNLVGKELIATVGECLNVAAHGVGSR